jgi:hypothetical protein
MYTHNIYIYIYIYNSEFREIAVKYQNELGGRRLGKVARLKEKEALVAQQRIEGKYRIYIYIR